MSEERDIERVLRAAGARVTPSEQAKAAVREAVRAEWRHTVARHNRRRQRVWLAAAAAVLAGVALWVSQPLLNSPGAVVASVDRTLGTVQFRNGRWSRWNPAAREQEVRAGETLRTGPDGRAALEFPNHLSVRLDHDTAITLVAPEEIEVRTGAIYVDAGESAVNALSVRTIAGSVRHLGTQYEVRLVDSSVRVRVREGRVELQSRDGSALSAAQGEELLISSNGAVTRGGIATTDAGWDWAASTAPAFEIEGRRAREFLEWAAREMGRELVFASAESEREASRAILSGSVADLSPAEAVAAVLPTTRLRGAEQGTKLVVMLDHND